VTGPRPRRRRQRPLRAVHPTGPRRAPFLFLALIIVGAAILGIVITQALVSETAFAVQKLVQSNGQLQESNDQLRLQAAQLGSPARIEEEARRLGMIIPSEVETITVAAATRSSPDPPGTDQAGNHRAGVTP
jgi:cell division protein FtsL